MKIIRITENENGSRPSLQDWNRPTPPEGYAFIPDEFVSVFYPPDKLCAGFVDITVEGSTVTACSWNEEAYQAYIAGLQQSGPEGPTVQDDIGAMLVDLERRLAMLELALTK